jgi:hypothetical protein
MEHLAVSQLHVIYSIDISTAGEKQNGMQNDGAVVRMRYSEKGAVHQIMSIGSTIKGGAKGLRLLTP